MIWKNGACIPSNGFCFVGSFLFCILKLYAKWCLHVSEMASLLIGPLTTLALSWQAPCCQVTFISHHLGLAGDPFKGQWNANYSPSWHLHSRYNISPLGERLLEENWEFGFLNTSHNHSISGLKDNWETEVKWGGRIKTFKSSKFSVL